MPFLLSFVLLVISSAITLGVSYYSLPTNVVLQANASLLLILLFFLNKYLYGKEEVKRKLLVQNIFLFLCATFVQLLVLSTGGFHSPFLILLHLFTLGVGFLVDLRTSMVFLSLALTVMVLNIRINPIMMKIFQDDPWSVVLYFASFIVIIPLCLILSRSYHLKGALSKILTDYIQFREQREISIMRGLSEFVVVTDKNIRIISANEALLTALAVEIGELVHHSLLEVIKITDRSGNLVTLKALSIESLLIDRTTRMIEGMFLTTKQSSRPLQISIQIRPIFNLNGGIDQIVFVLTDVAQKQADKPLHNDLEMARLRYKGLIEDLKNTAARLKQPEFRTQIELFSKVEQDLFDAMELADHPIKEAITFPDLAEICKKAVVKRQDLARSLGVFVGFELPESEVAEQSLLRLKETQFPEGMLGRSDFSAPVDARWFSIVIEKLLDMAILISSNQTDPKVVLRVSKEDKPEIVVHIAAAALNLTPAELPKLFIQYYGDLAAKTNLRLGSGLEGYLAKTIADRLDIPLQVTYELKNLHFFVRLSKSAHPGN